MNVKIYIEGVHVANAQLLTSNNQSGNVEVKIIEVLDSRVATKCGLVTSCTCVISRTWIREN